MTLKTPPLNATGVYSLISPWATVANTTYTCIAIRSFRDLIMHGIDVAATYYDPMGLGPTQYQADLSAGANLITLVSPNQPTIYVPDTYISAYPDLSNVAYNNIVLSCQLGPIPDSLDLSFLQSQMSGLVSDTIGVTPTVNVFVSPSTGVVTPQQAAALETSRQAAVTNRTTDRAKVLSLQNQLNSANQLITSLQNLAVANGWVATAPAPVNAADGTAGNFTAAITNLSVVFTDSSIPITGKTITSWSWNFGDDAGTSTVQNPSYVYKAAGTYVVELDVTDSNSQTAKVWKVVKTTLPPPVNAADGTTANFTSSATGNVVTFTDTSVPATGDTITGWAWSFGDGNSAAIQNPSHTYTSAGTYVVELTVTDSATQTAKTYKQLVVS